MRNVFFKDFWGCLLLIGFLLALQGCSVPDADDELLIPDLNNVGMVEDSLSADMVRILATGRSAVLGSENGKSNERPVMTVKFDYDFSIGLHEVTCDEFNEAMESAGLKPRAGCPGSIYYPAVNITYYDAVLYANARSKMDSVDTAYSYVDAVFDGNGNCIGLEGLTFNPAVDAYRLPTEAEWVYAARKMWDSRQGWHAGNSKLELHKVCTADDVLSRLSENDVFCDMSGNVKEWVNDWLGQFRDTTVSNYVGAPDGGTLGERVVKGGSFTNSDSSITASSRGDVYLVTSGTKALYIGFRLAYGKIPNAVWLGSHVTTASSSVGILSDMVSVRNMTGSYRNKLVFRNDESGNLMLLDYGLGFLTIIEFADSVNAYHPDISPDGKLVAFCTGLEGVRGPSSLYVRQLNDESRELIKLDVENAAIPRWRVTDTGDTVIVYVTSTVDNRDAGEFFAASTWQVPFSGGRFGVPQKLFDGAFHGGVSLDNRLAVSGTRLLRAHYTPLDSTKAAVDSVWYNSEQACNVSLAQDGTKRTLFLDFGGKTGQAFVGERYGTHKRILVLDSIGELMQSVESPDGFSFDHSEWVDVPYSGRNGGLVVTSLTDVNGNHKRIALLDMSNGNQIDLVQGDELWHPCFWTSTIKPEKQNSELSLDSAGVYLTKNHVMMQSKLKVKMDRYWRNADSVQVFAVGSSRMEMGLDPDLFPEWNMLNMAVTSIDFNRDMDVAEWYVLNRKTRINAVLFSLDIDGWRGDDGSWDMIQKQTPGFKYDKNHGFWKNGLPLDFIDAMENSYPVESFVDENCTARGEIYASSAAWDSEGVSVKKDSVFSDSEKVYMKKLQERFVKFIELANRQDITVIGIIFPQAPQYRETGSFGIYGMQRSVALSTISWLDSLQQVKSNFYLMDENKMGNHDYSDEMASNMDHLSFTGAAQLTTRVDSLLRTLR